jgi:predicted nucleotidyltransferase
MKAIRKWFITGSYAYGPISSNSDIDIVCLACEYQEIKDFITSSFEISAFNPSVYNNGIYLRRHNAPAINIIPLSMRSFVAWKFATEMMKCMHPIYDKNKRHSTFEILCGIVASNTSHLPPSEMEIEIV